MAEEHTWKVQTDDKGNPILPEATFTGVSTTVNFIGDRDGDVVQKFEPEKGGWEPKRATVIKGGVPVLLPATMLGDIDRRIGTADVLNDGTATIRLNRRGTELMLQEDVVNLSIVSRPPAVPFDLAAGEKRAN